MKNAKNQSKIFEIKKDFIQKEYDSIFHVYSRQTEIIYSFRKWNIALLLAFIGTIISERIELTKTISYLIPILTSLIFMTMEVGERVFMLYLNQELKYLEKIFMEEEIDKLITKVLKFEFRSLRYNKEKLKSKIKRTFKVFTLSQFLSWYLLIFLTTIVVIEFFYLGR